MMAVKSVALWQHMVISSKYSNSNDPRWIFILFGISHGWLGWIWKVLHRLQLWFTEGLKIEFVHNSQVDDFKFLVRFLVFGNVLVVLYVWVSSSRVLRIFLSSIPSSIYRPCCLVTTLNPTSNIRMSSSKGAGYLSSVTFGVNRRDRASGTWWSLPTRCPICK